MRHVPVAPESVGMSAERLARIQPMLDRYVGTRGFAGMSTLLARRGKVVHCAHAGVQDRQLDAPFGAQTIVRIYSMTKPVVCTALMMLFEQARFQLFEPVSKYLPALGKLRVFDGTPGNGRGTTGLLRPITIQDLLRHTAGFTYDFLEDSPVAALYRQQRLMGDGSRSLEAMVAELARLPLAYQPGSRWHYSVSIDVAAHLIEVLSDMPLQQFLQQCIFDPLGMQDTGFSVPQQQRERVATMYGHPDVATHARSEHIAAWQEGRNGPVDVSASYPMDNTITFARGGHGLFSTAGDYLCFAQMLLNRGELDGARLLGRRTVEMMHMNHLPDALLPYEIGGAPSAGYGFGLGSRVHMSSAESALPCGHGEYGWGGAARTFYWVDPREQLVGVLMTQFMVGFDLQDKDFLALAYQALVD